MLGKVLFAIFILFAVGLLVVAYSGDDPPESASAEVQSSPPQTPDSSSAGSGSASGVFTVKSASAPFADGCTISATQQGADYTYAVVCAPPTTFAWRGASFVGCRPGRVEWPADLITPDTVIGKFRDMLGDCGPGIVTAHLTWPDGIPLDVALSLATGGLVDALPPTA